MTPEIGPHGYLVLRRYHFDDLPVRFFWDVDDAIEYCNNIALNENEGMESMLDINLSDSASIVVIHFVNGKPIKLVYERSFD
ncbi:hypothetical protein LCGC14_2515990 [marine sediment metagenome]|uniref:Uncharacterized protein n=1 Tax=marine sediment metagenome TaxID=412755 RepID=A0A0F9BKR0_9ZZZZ